jgi:SAM-dependent methyltransferase
MSRGPLRLGLQPVDRDYGYRRGTPIDRHYIEAFLRAAGETRSGTEPVLRGRVLEVGNDFYTRRYADPALLISSDVVDVDPANEEADFVADLANAPELPSDAFDCVICTQTLLLIYDFQAAVATLNRIISPGGTLLLTVPGIVRTSRSSNDAWRDYWRFTDESVRRMLHSHFSPSQVTVAPRGNVKAAACFLYGLAAEELTVEELEHPDPDYPVVITARARKDGRAAERSGFG